MQHYKVTGMSCAACSARVEKAVSALPGVTDCAVSLLTNSMSVDGSADASAVISAVEAAGYGASVQGAHSSETTRTETESALEDKATPALKKRLIASLFFLAVLMYVSMGHMMLGWPLPAALAGSHSAVGLTELLLTVIIMVINQRFFISGFRGLIHRAPNMDTLVALGAGAAFVYSVYALYRLCLGGGMEWMNELYFESAAMILTLITVGKLLEARSKGKTTDALKALLSIAPKTARLVRDGAELEIPVEELCIGDVFALRPGDSVPVDGVVIEGSSAVDESALTGESIPVDKSAGDRVSAATINQAGYIRCRATRIGEDTTLSQIIRMVSDAAATKAPIAKLADRVSGVFVPAVMSIALVTLIVWLALGQSMGFALGRAISVLVISCPCALGLATPVAIMVGSGLGARHGVLFKTAAALEAAGRTEIVALDKTGTITEGKPRVTELIPAEGVSEDELLRLAAALESRSEHPLAAAVMERAQELGITPPEVTDFSALPGNGLRCALEGRALVGGSLAYISALVELPEGLKKQAEELSSRGRTPLLFAQDKRLLGIIAVADAIKPDSAEAVRQLKNMGVRVVMLTGDNRRTAAAIGKEAGVDDVMAELLPGDKEKAVRELSARAKVAMVGDGINDAPALTRADIGVAIGAGADIAIEAADVVLMHSKLSDVPAAIRLGRATLRNIKENLFWAFFYNCIGIPLAAGVFIAALGWKLNPMFGAAAMSLSSFCVVTNALRLNFFDMYSSKHDVKMRHKAKKQEDKAMTKTMKIEGMMCPHCEARVKKTLEAIEGVESAEVSHERGTAVVTLSKPVADEMLKSAVEAQDYEVTGVE